MNRRAFLQMAGGASAGVLTGRQAGAVPGPFIDRDQLRLRNRDRSTVVCQNGMVCASQPLASMAGIDVLKGGGNCIDAAIATNAVLGVTEPASNGIGGDLFAIVWLQAERRLYGLNASGPAPRAWTLEKAHDLGLEAIPRESPLSWTVPGCVRGWQALADRFGSQPLGRSLEAAIGYAEEGFPLSPLIATHFEWEDRDAPHMAAVYHPGGRVPRYGELFRNSALAGSLRAIADRGAEAFYRGEIAERIVAKSRELGGVMEPEDLAGLEIEWVEPVVASYRGWDVWELPPNGQGIAALQILNLLERFDVAALGPGSPEHLHLFIEAKKLAFEDRARFYADPAFADVPVEWLVSKEYAAQRAKLIDRQRASERLTSGEPSLDGDTVYLAAADADGNMISLIQSLYSGFGSTICPDEVGFAMQNRGQCFSLDVDHRNRLEPGKRPFHTIIPAFLTREGHPVMAFGVMGGDFQPQGHAQVIMNIIDFGMSPQQAGDQPRLRHDGSSSPWGDEARDGGELIFERGFADSVRLRLAEMGHRVRAELGAHGGYQAIWRRDDPLVYFGGSDPRKDGAAMGW